MTTPTTTEETIKFCSLCAYCKKEPRKPGAPNEAPRRVRCAKEHYGWTPVDRLPVTWDATHPCPDAPADTKKLALGVPIAAGKTYRAKEVLPPHLYKAVREWMPIDGSRLSFQSPAKLHAEEVKQEIVSRYEAGGNISALMREFGYSRATIRGWIKEAGVYEPPPK
jgi:Helix-turn-helix domain